LFLQLNYILSYHNNFLNEKNNLFNINLFKWRYKFFIHQFTNILQEILTIKLNQISYAKLDAILELLQLPMRISLVNETVIL
jgi:hypothetical protein